MSDLSQKIAALTPGQRQLLLQKLHNQKGKTLLRSPIIPQSRESNSFSLSFAQQRLWFLNQLQPGSIAFNISQPMRLQGWLNVTALVQSFQEIVNRHEILRTTFTTLNGQPAQIIAPKTCFTIPIVDLQALPTDKIELEVMRSAHEDAQQPFDLAKGPLLRVTLLQISEVEHVLLLTMHHIISDAWSVGILIREIKALYTAFLCGKPSARDDKRTPLPELPIQYADFAVWQQQWLQGEQLATQVDYWKQQLAALPILELPTDRPRPQFQTYNGAREYIKLPKKLSEQLKNLHQSQGITLFMTLLAAFQTLLYWYTKQENIVVGTDIANRNQIETRELIGFFVNQLVLRTDFSGNPTFDELLARIREMTLDAYAHQDLSFDKLVDILNPKRELNRPPLFQVKIILENTQTPDLELSGLTITSLNIQKQTTQLDLLLDLRETPQGIIGAFEYNTDLFNSTTITQMIRHFEILLNQIIAQPTAKLNELLATIEITDQQQQQYQNSKRKQTYQQKLKLLKRQPH
ncbi:MAG: condensation protein [Desmonostoc vinosum HA7617-LM4]|jgi:hypothetical protein|nr:condensation protein [Desmonostoc vinosum HA7617-LM4]